MKKTFSLIALAVTASFAGPVKFGVDVLAGYDIVSIGDNLDKAGTKSQASFGFGLGPTVKYPINDMIALNGSIQFQYDIVGVESKDIDIDQGVITESKSEISSHYMRLGLQFAPSYQFNEKISAKLGYEWDMPLGGSGTREIGGTSQDFDIVWAPSKYSDLKEKENPALSTHNLIVGGSYSILPNLAITLQGKIGLTGTIPEYEFDETTFEYGDLKGAESSKNNIKLHQIAIGANYSFN